MILSTKFSKALLGISFLINSSFAFATQKNDPLIKNCISNQLRNHQNIKSKPLDASDFNQYCSCVARVVRNGINDQQLNELNQNAHKAKPDWLNRSERDAQKQCMNDPLAKSQST
jgi:hypothetical protein